MSFNIKQGINILEWDTLPIFFENRNIIEKPSDRKWLGIPKSFEEKGSDFQSTFRFDHIRFMIFESYYFDENLNPRQEAFDELEYLFTLCKKWNLKLILVPATLRLHRNIDQEGSVSFWTEQGRESFNRFWVNLTKELQKYSPDDLALELLNEPVAPDHELWNLAIEAGIKGIREIDKLRTIVVCSNHFSEAATFKYLKVPQDKNLLLSFHCYQPMFLTHHHIPWVQLGNHDGDVTYPGIPVKKEIYDELFAKNVCKETDFQFFDKKKLEEIILPAIQKAKELALPLHCGEFGCTLNAPWEAREIYLNDMISLFNEHGIIWSFFDLQSDLFGLYDKKNTLTFKNIFSLIK